jgi:cyanophycinase
MKVPLKANFSGTGILSLVGSGEYLPKMEAVDRWLLSQLSEPARVVCLATAAGTEGQARIDYWDNLGTAYFKKLGAASVEAVPIINRSDAENPELAGRVRLANFVYLSGGKPNYLLQTLKDSLVWQAILSVLDNGGIVAGCSAGAMIFGEKIASSPLNWLLDYGFGLLSSVFIIPHYDEIPSLIKGGLPYVNRSLSLVGIDGNTALVCSASECRVIGSGYVSVSTTGGTIRYSCEEADLYLPSK